MHDSRELVNGNIGRDGEPVLCHNFFHALRYIIFAHAELLRRDAGANCAYRHCVTVRNSKIAASLYCVAERMPEIEFLTLARVKFIARDYVAFYLDAAAHDVIYIAFYVA